MCHLSKIVFLFAGAVAFALGLSVIGSSANADLLVYEPFDGYAAGAITGQNPTASTVGIDTSTKWAKYGTASVFASGTDQFTTGLTFGNLQTAGGAEFISSTGYLGVSAKVGAISSVSGTLYASYLISMSSMTGTVSNGVAQIRVGDTATFYANGSPYNLRYYMSADRDASTSTGPRLSYNAYDGSGYGTPITLGTTYMALARFTNVGSDPSTASPGIGTMWILTQDQFASFVAGGQNDAYLDAATVGTGATNAWAKLSTSAKTLSASGTNTFEAGDFFQLRVESGNASYTEAATFDELRFGTTIASVTPTPEPSSFILLVLGVFGLLAYAWRRRR